MNLRSIQVLFGVAALYDGVLGLLFFLAPGLPFEMFEVTPPNHMAYVQFPAALLLIFGLMFAAIARAPRKNRQLVIYGILLKISYSGITFFYWLTSGVPIIWKPFAVIDLIMLVLCVWAHRVLHANGESAAAG